MDDPLDDVEARLDALDDAPVAEHPTVLEEIAGALVAELDALAARTEARTGVR